MIDVGTSLKTWLQLTSAVALGGARNADTARRIALGYFNSSGRYYLDIEDVVSDKADASVENLALASRKMGYEIAMQLLTYDTELDEIAAILAAGDRRRFLHRQMHADMMGEIR